MPDEMDKLPTVQIFGGVFVTERRHSGEMDSVVDDVEQISIEKLLSLAVSQIGRRRRRRRRRRRIALPRIRATGM